MARLTVVSLVLLLVSCRTGAQKKKPIVTQLQAKWAQTPLTLEAAEFLNTESPDYFWNYVNTICKASPSIPGASDQSLYDAALVAAASSLSPAQLDLLKFALSLRTESPKIEMHAHLAVDRGVGELHCDTVFDHNNKLSCSLPDKLVDGVRSPSYSSDHIFPGQFTDATPQVI